MAPLPIPLPNTKVTFNAAGVAGFLGGDEAISAVATIPFYRGAQWFGWHNSPGTYVVAKHFSKTIDSRFRNGLFPGPNFRSPAIMFGVDGKKGPEYTGTLSGSTMRTGHAAYLAMERCKDIEPYVIHGREGMSYGVSYLAMKSIDDNAPLDRLPLTHTLWKLIPIITSIAACIMCALVDDWFSFSAILLGIIANGYAGCVIGNGKLVFKSPRKAALGSPPGHGILIGEEEVLVIKGNEGDVNAITRGHFDIETRLQGHEKRDIRRKQNGMELTAHSYYGMGVCILLLVVQFLQLVFIPQGFLFGQLMFVISLFTSWGCNAYLSSLEKEKIQMALLFRRLGYPEMVRFRAGTRTTMSVFVCLLLFHGVERSKSPKTDRALRENVIQKFLPNQTSVWNRWREKVLQQILNMDESGSLHYLEVDERDRVTFSGGDTQLRMFENLLEDARTACREYLRVRERLPVDSTHVG